MTGSIQALSNMEYMLYGNAPAFGNYGAPSMANGYCASTAYMNSYPYYNTYNNYSNYPSSQNVYSNTSQGNQISTATQKDIDKIANFYNEKAQPSQSLIGAAAGGAVFGAINHPRIFAHPINTVMASSKIKSLFADVKTSGSALNKLWTAPETNNLMREAYFRMHKIEARQFSKLGLFRKQLSEADYTKLKGIMENALKSGDANKIAEATAQLEQAYISDGFIARNFNKAKNKVLELFGKTPTAKPATVNEALADTAAISKRAAELAQPGNLTFSQALKRGGGIKGGLFMMGIELLMGLGNITEAFKYDKENKQKGINTNYGIKQIGQTLVKGAGSAAGWAVGEAAGVWASAKICASIGTAISPGLGTIIGGILGVVGGSIGMWLTGKLTKKLVGQDVGEKIKLEKMKQTPEGQFQLLQLTASQKDIPVDVQQSMQNVINQYSTAA